MAGLTKTAAEYCELEKRRKDCELCLDKFRLVLLMVEKGIRDGITQAVKRYAEVNNKYMKDLYLMYLQYLGANNLYG